METKRWQLNRSGMINFWYYDKQEFDFADGRMLLRGSNGSGKSVTMQSFIPLLLDGNRSPERLDPFGSKSRKLDDYMLEEQDDRDERTAYLYLEFRQPEVELYRTIGMGIRARKNEKLDTWYFYLGNEKRIDKNFSLYRNKKEVNVLTKRELKQEIGEDGQVFTSQRDYMEEVNRQLFGFDSSEEYKELINLLIQLRSPKLSKDFKPTVISEILTNSLQPLSDEDLRPLSESIENMDAIEANLANLNVAHSAINRLTQAFIYYNSAVFRTRTLDFASEVQDLEKLQTSRVQLGEEMEQNASSLNETKRLLEELTREQEIRKKQIQDLKKQDVVVLKEKQQITHVKLDEESEQLKKKQGSIETKKASIQKIEREKKVQQDKADLTEREIDNLLGEMQRLGEQLSFDEHTFFEDELRKQLSKEYSYVLTDKAIQDLKASLRSALEAVRHTKENQEKYDCLLKEQDQMVEERNKTELDRRRWDNQLEELRTEWTISFKHWLLENQVMHFRLETEEHIYQLIQSSQQERELSPIMQLLHTEQNLVAQRLGQEKLQLSNQLKQVTVAVEEKKAERQKWINRVDPEPERTAAVLRNRQLLKEKGIPYVPFYQTIDFQNDLSDTDINLLEELLLEAGLLDALVVPQKYKKEVLQHEQGVQDRYLFVDDVQGWSDLTAYLKTAVHKEEEWDEQDLRAHIEGIVQGVTNKGVSTSGILSQEGFYHAGPLYGTVSGEYQAKFIGVYRRQQYRLEVLEQLQAELDALLTEKQGRERELYQVQNNLDMLEREAELFPDRDDLVVAFQEIEQLNQKIRFLGKQLIDLERLVSIAKKQYDQAKIVSRQACLMLGMEESLPHLQEAIEDSEQYQDLLTKLKIKHHSYVSDRKQLTDKDGQMEESLLELGDLVGEENRFKRSIKVLTAELDALQQQLDASGYEEVRQQLEEAFNRMRQLPDEIKEAIRIEATLENEKKNQFGKKAELAENYKRQQKKLVVLYQNYLDEVQLGHVFEEEKRDQYREELRTLWQDTSFSPEQLNHLQKLLLRELKNMKTQSRYKENEKSISDATSALQNEYIIQKNQLADYAIQLKTIFYDSEYPELLPAYNVHFNRNDIQASLQGKSVTLFDLQDYVKKQVEINQELIKKKDRILFEDIVTNTIGKKIRGKIHTSEAWVKEMNGLMRQAEDTASNGFVLSLKWKHKAAQQEGELGSRELIDLLKMEADLMTDSDAKKLTQHFRSKIKQARDQMSESKYTFTFHTMLKEVLDYRKWFEFQLSSKKAGENMAELTNNKFFALSGGEKAMAMYVPLFSAVVAKYRGARADAPRIISLDEAFAGIDEQNIRDMFRYMVQFKFNFMINSQILWGDYDTVPTMRIYQLLRPNNAKFVTVIPYLWNGYKRTSLGSEEIKKLKEPQEVLF